MPQLKASFARLSPIDASQLESLAQRLRRVAFEGGEGLRVLGVDREPGAALTVQAVLRKLREARHFDEAEGKFVAEKAPLDREIYFSCDLSNGIASAPSRRDFGLLVELLRRAGAGRELEAQPLVIDLVGWLREVLHQHDSAQLGQLVLDGLYMEPRMIGRFTAKTVDNRIDLAYLEKAAGQLRSIRVGYFADGARRTVEARSDATLSVTSSDEDDARELFGMQRARMLSHQLAGGDELNHSVS